MKGTLKRSTAGQEDYPSATMEPVRRELYAWRRHARQEVLCC